MAAEDLVPKGLPHGERQRTVQAMRRAGLPTSTSPSEAPGVLPEARRPVSRRRPSFDALANRKPPGPPGITANGGLTPVQSPIQSFRQKALGSNNPLLAEIGRVLSEYL
ncbi:MAG: hypothetical protein DWQ20_07060 [Actinobacteria bacterium]|nr:MAG: hypothetical protein DWQ20_07060 [Actinomycetota bacterium]